jgi:hypothetical protein
VGCVGVLLVDDALEAMPGLREAFKIGASYRKGRVDVGIRGLQVETVEWR